MTFRPGEYRAKAEYYAGRVEAATNPEQRLEFQELEGSFKALADNEQWLANNHGKTVHSTATPQEGAALAREEEHVLRCLGAALLMHWDTLPEDIRREIFDNASAMGELLDTEALRQKIGRLLHKHDNANT